MSETTTSRPRTAKASFGPATDRRRGGGALRRDVAGDGPGAGRAGEAAARRGSGLAPIARFPRAGVAQIGVERAAQLELAHLPLRQYHLAGVGGDRDDRDAPAPARHERVVAQ